MSSPIPYSDTMTNEHITQGVTTGKDGRGSWCVYVDGQLISDHRTRDGAQEDR